MTSGRVLLASLFSAGLLIGCAQETEDPCTEAIAGDEVVACQSGVAVSVLGTSGSNSRDDAYARLPLAQDSEFLYWAGCDGQVLRTPKSGGTTDVIDVASQCVVNGLAVDHENVYWAKRCRDEAGAVASSWFVADKLTLQVSVFRESASSSGPMAVAGDQLVWAERAGEDSTTLMRLPTSDLGAIPESRIVLGGPYLPFIASESALYFSVHPQLAETSSVRRQPWAGLTTDEIVVDGYVESLVDTGASPGWVVADYDPVEHGDVRSLWGADFDGSAVPERLVPGVVPELMAIDGSDYYGIGHLETAGTVALRLYRFSPPDYAPVALAAALHWPEAIVLDSANVYWLDSTTGCTSSRLMRASR